MTDRNANRPGYKQTKVGWIPEEWSVTHLEEISEINKENLPASTPDDYSFTYISLGDVDSGIISMSSDQITFSTAPSRARRIIHKGDILLSTVRPYLKGFTYIDFLPKDIICSTGFAVITPKNDIDGKFLYQYIFSKKAEKYFNACVVGSNYPALNNSDVEKMSIPLPQPSEQKKIAEILSTWDRVIEQTQKLIDAKQRLKKGLMQQLLTGRMRFPGFGAPVENAGELPEGWEKHQMSNVINILGGGTPARKEEHYWHGDIPWLAVGDFSDATRYVHDSEEKITEEGLENSNTKLLEKGAVIISARGTVGAIAQLAKPMAFNQTSYGLLGKEKFITNDYLFYFLKNNIQLFAGVKYGAVFDTITKDTFKYVDIKVPELIEQIRITNILSTIDKEIDLLRNRIIFFSKQKHGLMQKLLNGEVRAKI